ncbi:MAG TPA: nucleotidyltransferase domain-containing protein [Polyangiaceae bacterium]|nr:nucleotidyltransferase domain-containing protein [Polyangiaceae bacterium]
MSEPRADAAPVTSEAEEPLAGLLSEGERGVMARVLAEESQKREHVVVYLSGAHAYGFPSPDSDLDLKAIHVCDTAELLGFELPATTVDRAEVLDGVEIDYTSNELGHVLAGILQGNGNFLERVLGRTVCYASPLLAELRPLAERSLSRRAHRHYRGFAQNQLRALAHGASVKKLLYVLRTALTGVHLLETGALEASLPRLLPVYGLEEAAELVEQKRAGERVSLEPQELEAWRARVDATLARLDAAAEKSPLPAEPPNEAEVRAWLLSVRKARFR